jgi:hypothetical protein
MKVQRTFAVAAPLMFIFAACSNPPTAPADLLPLEANRGQVVSVEGEDFVIDDVEESPLSVPHVGDSGAILSDDGPDRSGYGVGTGN